MPLFHIANPARRHKVLHRIFPADIERDNMVNGGCYDMAVFYFIRRSRPRNFTTAIIAFKLLSFEQDIMRDPSAVGE